MYEIKEPFWQCVNPWQTLIAALIAGVLAVVAAGWTVWATIKLAKRQIAAAQDQTKAAQRQTEEMGEIEHRRIASEGYAFHAMLEAAMGSVIEDVKVARSLRQSYPRPVR
jgi:hypothetical protein